MHRTTSWLYPVLLGALWLYAPGAAHASGSLTVRAKTEHLEVAMSTPTVDMSNLQHAEDTFFKTEREYMNKRAPELALRLEKVLRSQAALLRLRLKKFPKNRAAYPEIFENAGAVQETKTRGPCLYSVYVTSPRDSVGMSSDSALVSIAFASLPTPEQLKILAKKLKEAAATL